MTSVVMLLAMSGVNQLFHHNKGTVTASAQAPSKVMPVAQAPTKVAPAPQVYSAPQA